MMTRRNNQESIKEHVWCPVHCCKKTGEMNLDLIKKAGLAGSLENCYRNFTASFSTEFFRIFSAEWQRSLRKAEAWNFGTRRSSLSPWVNWFAAWNSSYGYHPGTIWTLDPGPCAFKTDWLQWICHLWRRSHFKKMFVFEPASRTAFWDGFHYSLCHIVSSTFLLGQLS